MKVSDFLKALFYKTKTPSDKIRREWALAPRKTLPTPGMFRRYGEITWGMTFGAALVAMLLSSSLMWVINIPFFATPTPLNTVLNGQELHIDGSMETHVPALIRLAFFELTTPMHKGLTEAELHEQYPAVVEYKYYLSLMSKAGLAYLLWVRFLFIGVATALAGYIAFLNSNRFLFRTEFIIESEGAKIYEGLESEAELAKFWGPAYSTFDKKYTKFANMGQGIYHPEDQRRQHTFIVGNSGSGKSQILQEFIFASIDKGLKTVILDPKSEWTKAIFDENDPSIALIDPTDARSHVWSFMEDLNGIGSITSFVASVIPSGGGKDKMWTNAARMVNVAMFLFLKETLGDKATFKDVADVVQLSKEQIGHIVQKYYPHALQLVGKIAEDGEIEGSETADGIMINMISFMEYFIDLARYWNKPEDKSISLRKFMTDPDYHIKTIIIRPNEEEGRMARGITANALAYMMNYIKKPDLYGSKTVPVGNFILDEFQSPGKLEDENGDPVLQTVIQQARSFGWAVYFATQTIPECERIYGKEVIAGWRGTIGTQILAAAPTDNLQPWIDGFGDKKIQKYHLSQSTGSNGDVSYSGNWQEHVSKVMIPTTLAAKLRNEDPFIKFLIIPVGCENLYFISKFYKSISSQYVGYVGAGQTKATITPSSRVLKMAKQIVSGKEPNLDQPFIEKVSLGKPVQEETAYDRFAALDQEYADQDDMPAFEDMGQYADQEEGEIETEASLNVKFPKYDITPSKEEEESVEGEVIKDAAFEALLDSHALNAIRQLFVLLTTNQNKKVLTTDLSKKIKFDNKRRYKNSNGPILKKHKSESL